MFGSLLCGSLLTASEFRITWNQLSGLVLLAKAQDFRAHMRLSSLLRFSRFRTDRGELSLM